MDKPILKESLRLLSSLGKISSRSMFGGFGVFIDDTMFALVVQDKLHLRSSQETINLFKEQGFEPYVYKKRGFPVVTKYFALSEDCWHEPDSILLKAVIALDAAKKDKEKQKTAEPSRIKDLPNLRLATERMLKKAGINTVEELRNTGSVNAYKAIQQTHSSHVSDELLWSLEGAIKGTHWSVVSSETRCELRKQL
ncbi:TfoX/Sxy family DNA transformation protein [Aliivibrio sp. S3MY1]|uniref:TfoX/Sxy family DNA transformation protein n=1 Tax=unclassified Aliivibrio TaxID=2645654 RepID=UPI0023791053|nr:MULTISPECIES: TfoX/Sxy family DNA transformation protein [unclassified Aliivibrio]MDD9196340.1 TfoX/Sxy family DNA transformation protein [Aliivibrio sp. S3MY1]MDD9200647.1 TfoX/Sxy family DNA transformation protein [Aliivibrio sp. S2MY1]